MPPPLTNPEQAAFAPYHAARVIARYTVAEALRNRLLWLVAATIAASLIIAGFLHSVAITESSQIQSAILAAILRLSAVFIIVSFVVTSMVREANDKGLEIILALPLPRGSYFFGKLAGFTFTSVVLAVLFGLPLCLFAPWLQVGAWTASLACELVIMTTLSLFCVMSLNQVTSALAAAAGFYVLCRSIGTIQVIAAAPLDSAGSLANDFIRMAIDGVAMLLPHLDRVTRTEWLLYAAPDASVLAVAVLDALLYGALLCGAALFDLYRKNF
jgi:ABC-type transport system involved in multi-copper enzyme maturation permease subunit